MSQQPDRQQFIGGSDAAAVLGLSRWRTPLQVWLSKTGQAEPEEPNAGREKLFRRGKLMEPVVIQMLEFEHPIKITRRSHEARNYRHHHAHPFLAAEIDFEWEVTPEMVEAFPAQVAVELVESVQNGEVKTVNPLGAGQYGEEGTDEIPIEYGAQAMHGLMVTGRELALVPVLVGSDNLLLFWVKRDEETIEGMRQKLVAFWTENVLGGRPPEPLNIGDIYRMFRRRPATRVEASETVAGMISTLRALKARAATTGEAIDAVQFELGTFILGAAAMADPAKADKGKHVVTVGGAPILTVAWQEQERIDVEALRLRFPEAAKACVKPSQFYKFNLTRRKS